MYSNTARHYEQVATRGKHTECEQWSQQCKYPRETKKHWHIWFWGHKINVHAWVRETECVDTVVRDKSSTTKQFLVPDHPCPAWRWLMIVCTTDWQFVSSWIAALLEIVMHACTVHMSTLRLVRARSPHCLCCSPYRCSPPSDIWQNLVVGGDTNSDRTKNRKIKHSLLFFPSEATV